MKVILEKQCKFSFSYPFPASPPMPEGISPVCLNFLQHCFTVDQKQRAKADELVFHPFIMNVQVTA